MAIRRPRQSTTPRNRCPLMTNSNQPETAPEIPASTPTDTSLMARLEEAGGQMTFFEHLSELRKRIINSLYAIGVGAFAGVYIAPKVIHFINEPMQKALVSAGYA